MFGYCTILWCVCLFVSVSIPNSFQGCHVPFRRLVRNLLAFCLIVCGMFSYSAVVFRSAALCESPLRNGNRQHWKKWKTLLLVGSGFSICVFFVCARICSFSCLPCSNLMRISVVKNAWSLSVIMSSCPFENQFLCFFYILGMQPDLIGHFFWNPRWRKTIRGEELECKAFGWGFTSIEGIVSRNFIFLNVLVWRLFA